MNVDFTNINDHITSMDRFQHKWQFIDDMYGAMPEEHLRQLKPLDADASRFLWDYLDITNLHYDIPFKKDFFQTIDKAKILEDNQQEIKKWLYHRGLPFEREVFLSWQPKDAMIVPWKLLIKYFDHFGCSDLTIFEQSLQWALLFYHEYEIYFGTKKEYKPSDTFNDYNFIW
jgi:hypothetical protein